MKRFIFLALVLILTVGLVLTGCNSTPTTQAPATSQASTTQAKEPIKVGFVSSYSGNVGVNGPSQKRAFQLAVKQLNAKGGILGGRMIQDLYYDDGTQPEQAKTAATKAVVQDKVKIVVGSFLDGCSVAIRDVCAQYNIPFVSAIAGPPITWMDDYPYNVNMGAGAGPQWASARAAVESRGFKTVAIVHGDSGWTQILKTMSNNTWNKPDSPVKIVAEVMHPLGGASDLKT
jgi:ABC-type branched-subunit amino acid transport system substrate-binding protein